jgi:hypothetical protein
LLSRSRRMDAGRVTPMPVSFNDIMDAFEFVSVSASGEHQAYVCKQTGKVYCHAEGLEDLEELPEDIEENDNYLAIPDKRELDLGKPLVLDFAREHLPNDFDEVRRIFSKRGAYAGFKNLLIRRRALDRWYDFEAKATEAALREWCELNSIELAE